MESKRRNLISTLILVLMLFLTSYLVIVPIFKPTQQHLEIKMPVWVFYTMQTNLFVCIWYAHILFRKLRSHSLQMNQQLVLALTSYILSTGIIYWLVLVPMLNFNPMLFSFRNIWLHTVTPVYSYICFRKTAASARIQNKDISYILVYPLMYLLFSLLFVLNKFGKYTYPFINPEVMGGLIPVMLACAGLFLFLMGIAYALKSIHNKCLLKNN